MDEKVLPPEETKMNPTLAGEMPNPRKPVVWIGWRAPGG
jgi:hypothetical protein